MGSKTRTALVLACTAALAGSMAVPASAADTTTTVTITGGSISLAAPPSAALSTGTAGQPSTATIGTTTVTDLRAGEVNWTATVSLLALTGRTLTEETIPTTEATYLASTANAISGSPTFVAPAIRTDLTSSKVSQTTSAISGNNSASWTAALMVPIPAQVLADTYDGVLTQSVS